MDEFKHPFIVGSHKLKLSNMELLARELAIKLNLAIQIEDKDGLKITFGNEKATFINKLKPRNTFLIPELKYEFLIENFKLFMYDDFIEIKINFQVDYYNLLDMHERKKLKDLEFFQDFFKILTLLGCTEIYIGIFEEFSKGKKINYKWRNVLKEVSNTTNFKISLL